MPELEFYEGTIIGFDEDKIYCELGEWNAEWHRCGFSDKKNKLVSLGQKVRLLRNPDSLYFLDHDGNWI